MCSQSDNDQVHRARGPRRVNVEQPKSVNAGEDVEKPKDERAPVQRFGTPGMGVIVVGCKSPVRDRKSQGGQYTKWILRSTKYEAKATAGGRPTVGRKPAIVCVSAGSV